MDAQTPTGTRRTINGQVATLLPPSVYSGTSTYGFPGLGVELEVAGPRADSLVHSIGWSSRYLVLHPPTPATVPHGWGTATYEGVTVRLPKSWPLTRVGPAHGEPGCGADFSTPKLLEGPLFGHGCPLSLYEPPSVDGVWLQGDAGLSEAKVAAPGYEIVRTTPTRVFLDDSQDPMGVGPLLHLFVVTQGGHHVEAIDVGLGSDPTIARAIIASISVTDGSGNSTTNPTAPSGSQTASTVTAPPGPTMTTTTSLPTTQPVVPTTCGAVATTYQPYSTNTTNPYATCSLPPSTGK